MNLTESQIGTFYEEGYLQLDNVLESDDLQPVIDEYSEIIDKRAQKLCNEGKVSSLHADEPFTRRIACLAKEAPEVTANLDIMQTRVKATFNFLMNSKILDIAESLVGSEIVCNPIQHIRAVTPHPDEVVTTAKGTPWHQDAAVCWPETDPYFILTIWVPIVDSTLENGCLEVIPGSHKNGLYEGPIIPGQDVQPEMLPPLNIKPLPLAAGGLILFHNYTLHHAQWNKSDTVRWSFDLRYNDAYQPSGRPFYPSFLMRSKHRPDALQTDYETWCQRWEFALEAAKGAKRYRMQ